MGEQGRQEGEGKIAEADLPPFVMKALMNGVQIRAAAESARAPRRAARQTRKELRTL